MSDREIVGTGLISRGLNVCRSTASRIVKQGELKAYEYGDNPVLLHCRRRDIEAFKRKKRGE